MSFSEFIQTTHDNLSEEDTQSSPGYSDHHDWLGKQMVVREENRGLFFRLSEALALITRLSSRRKIGLRRLMPIRLLCVTTFWGALAWKNHSYPFAIVSAAYFWLGATHLISRAFASGIDTSPNDPGISFFAPLAPREQPDLCFQWHEPLFFLMIGVLLCLRISPSIGTWLILCAVATAYVERARVRTRIFELVEWRGPQDNP